MAAPLPIAKGATLPGVEVEVRDEDGELVDFSLALSIRFRRRPLGGLQDLDKPGVSPAQGILQYPLWLPAETATEEVYAVWFYVDWGGGAAQETPEQIVVVYDHAPDAAPADPVGPCTAWADADSVGDACGLTGVEYDVCAQAASELLFELSGRKFTGPCTSTVRPCRAGCSCWEAFDRRGHYTVHGVPYPAYSCYSDQCGCAPLSEVRLAGHPVTTVSEVLVDGAALLPAQYRLDERHLLVRVDGLAWPGCQNLVLPDSEPGTWSVTYVHGLAPPQAGVLAAQQLACEICASRAPQRGECALSDGATSVSRQGITVSSATVGAWYQPGGRGWQTGMSLVDAFLNAYNPGAARRRAAVWSPDLAPYPRRTP